MQNNDCNIDVLEESKASCFIMNLEQVVETNDGGILEEQKTP